MGQLSIRGIGYNKGGIYFIIKYSIVYRHLGTGGLLRMNYLRISEKNHIRD
jgi:hypothetical protein